MEKVVFTNGCFDLIHPGHIDLLERAKKMGTKLIVGINSDKSVRKIKGAGRPFQSQEERKMILENLKPVDEVIIFDELTPENLIKNIKPDVLIKGGDWNINEIIGADFVLNAGGEVHSLSLKNGYSSSKIAEKIKVGGNLEKDNLKNSKAEPSENSLIENSLKQHIQVFETILRNQKGEISECAEIIYQTISEGGKILICGNGGSAADAQHIAAELVGRFENERRALPAIALTTDTSALTALANDYDFERIFSRQVEALARTGDCLIALSTSGNSPNVISAVMEARKKGCKIIGLTGAKGKKLASLTDGCILIRHDRTARIQEAHIAIGHIWCEIIDEKLSRIL
jgi:D-sedoheptulose 7-phosphate isomerase